MAYYISMRSRDELPVTVREFRQRLLHYGLEPHPDFNQPDEHRSSNADTAVAFSGGMIEVGPCYPDLDAIFGKIPLDLSVLNKARGSARISWSYSPAVVEVLVQELYTIAQAVNADLLGSDGQILGPDAPQVVARDFARYKDAMTIRRRPRPAKPAESVRPESDQEHPTG